MELDLQGSIERFTLPEILQLVASGRKSGTLGIQKDESIVMIYFDQGDVIYGYGPRQTCHLGRLLTEKGVITTDQLSKAVSVQAKSENSRRLGEILIARKYIDRIDLEKVVKDQVRELLYSIMTWQSGTFKFYENQHPTDEEITVRISVENVILEGLRRMDEMNMVRETLSDFETVYMISSAQVRKRRDVSFEPDEWNIMAQVDSRQSVEEICKASPIDRNRTLVALAKLKLAGIIVVSDRPKIPTVSGIEGMVNRLAGLFEEYLTEKNASRSRINKVTLKEMR